MTADLASVFERASLAVREGRMTGLEYARVILGTLDSAGGRVASEAFGRSPAVSSVKSTGGVRNPAGLPDAAREEG